MLEYLRLDVGIDYEVAIAMLNSVSSKTTLKKIDFRGMQPFSPIQWQTFFNVLGGSNLSLEKLDLSDNNIDDDAAVVALVDAVESMSSLKKLYIPINPSFVTVGWPAIKRSLCDTSSISATHSSNHTLEKISGVGREDHDPDDMGPHYLNLNKHTNKAKVARQKILQFHFYSGGTKVQEFVGMKTEMVPHAIAWIGRDGVSIDASTFQECAFAV